MKTLKKSLLLLFTVFTLAALFCFGASALSSSGSCGDNVTYTYNSSTKELVISGAGAMTDYSFDGSPFYASDIKSVVIKEGVTTIGDGAFCNCDSLQSVTIPDSVTTIGDHVFDYCINLKHITIPDSVTTIGSYAFCWCDSLQSVTIGDSVTTIGDYAFYECDSLQSVTIPDSVTTIGSAAFAYCHSLQSVTIGGNVTTIDSYAFYSCYSLKDVYYKGTKELWNAITIGTNNSPLTNSTIHYHNHTDSDSDSWCDVCDEYCISELVKTGKCGENVIYKWYEDGMLVISGSGAMYSSWIDQPLFFDSSIRSVVIKDGVTTIGYKMFEMCTILNSVTIANTVTSVGENAFMGCDSLQSVTIPDSVTSMGFDSFSHCENLQSVIIGSGITSIEWCTFEDCTNLQSVTFTDKVTYIGESAFSGCRSLKDIYYTGTREQWNAITVEEFNDYFTKATVHYNYCGPIHKNIVDVPQQKPTCTKVGYTAGKQCSHCEEWISGHTEIPTIPHTYKPVLTKATFTANGKIESKCSCGKVQKTETIAKVSSLTLSTTKYIYDGKNKTPKLTVKDSNGKTLVKNTDYKITVASKRAGIGRYTVKVTLIGNYSGSKNLYFYILPGKSASVKSASQTVSSVKLSWSAVPGAAGYTIYRYSSSKKAYVKEGTTEGTSYTVKSLYAGKKYTFRVVAYGKTASGKVYNSETYALLKTATKTKTPILSDTVAYKGKVKLFWTPTTGETGYTVYYSTSKTSGFKKYKNYESNSGYVNNLTSGKTYYFKVRTYIKTDSGYVYSPWSNIKGVKVK